MTGLPYQVGLALVLGGVLAVLAGLALIVMARRPRYLRDDPTSIELDEILEPRTTVMPQVVRPTIRPAARPPGELFTPYENPGD